MTVQARRLHLLADLLEENAKDTKGMKFDLDKVGYIEGNVPKRHTPTELLTCNTVGCAMGLAAMSGRFKRAGLRYTLSHRRISISYRGNLDFVHCASALFGIDATTARWLFVPNYSYKSFRGAEAEREVARRVRFIAEGGVIYDYRDGAMTDVSRLSDEDLSAIIADHPVERYRRYAALTRDIRDARRGGCLAHALRLKLCADAVYRNLPDHLK